MKKVLLSLLLIACFSLSGCVTFNKKQDTTAVDGGVFKTANKGTTWKQAVLLPTTSGRPASFSSLNLATMSLDPSDHNAVYYGSMGSGLLYTYDGANNWYQAKDLGNSVIWDIAVDPNNKCIIYASIQNKLFRSMDCNRSYSRIYYDNEGSVFVSAIAVDHYDSNNIYIGVTRGDLIASSDKGESWRTIKRFNKKITDLYIDPNDSRIMYVRTASDGVFRSDDNGNTWQNFSGILNELKKGNNIKDIILFKDKPDLIYYVMNYGILKSTDGGKNWEKIDLILPDNKANVNSAAINPQNEKEMYYVTNRLFYRSNDGGQNWTPTQLPTSRAGWKLLIDPVNPNILYLGVRALQK